MGGESTMQSDEALRRMVARINASAYLPSDIGDHIVARRLEMAKQVKLAKGREFKFASPKGGGSKYAWDEFLTGELLMLEQACGTGVDDKGNITGITKANDFAVSVDAMVPKIKTAGRKRYKAVETSRHDADGKRLVGALIIRSRDMTPDERVAEDKRRIYEKDRDEETRRIRDEASNGLPDQPGDLREDSDESE